VVQAVLVAMADVVALQLLEFFMAMAVMVALAVSVPLAAREATASPF
jgi:hypothetical protein